MTDPKCEEVTDRESDGGKWDQLGKAVIRQEVELWDNEETIIDY